MALLLCVAGLAVFDIVYHEALICDVFHRQMQQIACDEPDLLKSFTGKNGWQQWFQCKQIGRRFTVSDGACLDGA